MKDEYISQLWRAHGFYTAGHIILAPHDWHRPPEDDVDIDYITYDFVWAINSLKATQDGVLINQRALHSDITKNG